MVEIEAKGGVEDPEFEVVEDEGAVRWIGSRRKERPESAVMRAGARSSRCAGRATLPTL
jgi:hypothetical protein